MYIIEDIVGSYKTRYNGSPRLELNKNLVSYFSQFVHSTNSSYLIKEKQKDIQKLKDIDILSFYKNCIYMRKKLKNDYEFFTDENAFISLSDHNNIEGKVLKKNNKGFMNIDD